MFLQLEDFRRAIREEHLQAIIDNEPTVLEAAIDDAIADMQPYLRPVYDVETIFSQEGDKRDRFLMNIAIDIALYRLLERISPDQIPQLRRDKHDLAMERLEKISEGKLALNAPRAPREDGEGQGPRSYGRTGTWYDTTNPY
jgi:phage gp36-like protein